MQADTRPISHSVGNQTLSDAGSILIEAHELVNRYGNRPLWPLKSYRPGENVPDNLAPEAIAYLIACESQCVSVKHLDSNNAYSYGILQIQSSTWADFEQQSGLSGDPMNPVDAVQMGLWAVEHGYLQRWSCAKLTGLLR